jgi:hypothetical protein
MARRYADLDPTRLLRAARLARLPGVKRSEACARFGLSAGMLRRALRELAIESIPTARDIVLHAITDAGAMRAGELPSLATVASYCDYVNKDGATEADIGTHLGDLQREGLLAIEGTRWRLLRDFP